MPKITYDQETKITNIRINKNKIVDSEIVGNCVLDLDSEGKVVNIEILETKIL